MPALRSREGAGSSSVPNVLCPSHDGARDAGDLGALYGMGISGKTPRDALSSDQGPWFASMQSESALIKVGDPLPSACDAVPVAAVLLALRGRTSARSGLATDCRSSGYQHHLHVYESDWQRVWVEHIGVENLVEVRCCHDLGTVGAAGEQMLDDSTE